MPSPSLPNSVRGPVDPLDDLRRDMMIWAEPVIADRIRESYDDHKVGTARGRRLAIHHRRLWRALILQQPDSADPIRRLLALDLVQAGLPPGIVKNVDYDVAEELMDIVSKRFGSSRDAARGFGRVLLSAVSSIGGSEQAAA